MGTKYKTLIMAPRMVRFSGPSSRLRDTQCT